MWVCVVEKSAFKLRHVRPSTRCNAAPTGRNLAEFYIRDFYEYLWRHCNFDKNQTAVLGVVLTVHHAISVE
jgi:hypothetical protein